MDYAKGENTIRKQDFLVFNCQFKGKKSVHYADMEENIQRQVSHILMNTMYVVQRGK